MKVAVLGSGGWGTALAMLLVENGHDVTLWSYQAEESRHLAETGENPLLPGVKLPRGLTYTSDLSCVTGCAVVVMATPSFGVRSTAGQVKDLLAPDAILVSVSKGIEKGTSLRMTQIIREVTEDKWPVVALSGPSHAEEVARQVPTAVVSACPDQTAAEVVQDLFINDHFRVYSSSDVIGVELGAALKNVMALCTGCCTGHGPGGQHQGHADDERPGRDGRLGTALGARKDTFAGLAGHGGPDRHLHLHELPELPGGHFNWSGHPCPGGDPEDRGRGRGLLRRGLRQGAGGPSGRGNAHHPGRLRCPVPGPGPQRGPGSPSCVGKNAMRSRKLGSKLHFFEKSAK